MHKKLLIYFFFITLLPACNNVAPHITVMCEENSIGNCVVKWETTPPIQGHVKVYASTNPNHISEHTPVAVANITDQRVTVVTKNPSERYYYTLVFNDKYRVKTATRNINIAGIQNFRDLGGYPSYNTHKQVRWGMIYRSAEINRLNDFSFRELKHLGIKTIVDLRGLDESANKTPLQEGIHIIHIPVTVGSLSHILQGIENHSIQTDTVYRIAEAGSRALVREHIPVFRQLFDVLLEKDNYPLIIHCSSGKGRTGIAAALILSALDVNSDIIMEDYLLSNKYFDIARFSKFAYHLPTHTQEAITTLFSAKESFLNAAKNEIEHMYGDVDTYLRKGIGLKKEEIKKLQKLLLEKNQ